MEELSKAMESLKLHADQRTKLECLDLILQVLDDEELDRDTTTKSLLDQGILTELHKVLQPTSAHRVKTAQVVAEIAKTEEARKPCVAAGLVPPLVEMLSIDDLPSCTQACRALGNICFDNDDGRNVITEHNGIQRLIDVMKSLLNHTAEGSTRLRMVSCGLLLNLTNTHETVQEKALGHSVLDILEQYLCKHSTNEGVVQMALLSVGSLADTDTGKEKLLQGSLLSTIINLLATETGEDLQEAILELLTNLAESDPIKVALAKTDLAARLMDLLERSKEAPEDERQLTEKMVSDLLVLVLTGDESMELMYCDGKGCMYLESLRWLQSSSEQLSVSGALAVGNFARNDSQCMNLVQLGIPDKLLTLLENDNDQLETGPTLQHAVFSALRNLAIPAANKPLMLKCKLIERLLPHINTEFSSVQFKLLGTLRMVIDGQGEAAKQLGTNCEFLDKLVIWCTVEEHAGVKGEANRLISWLIKHSRDGQVMSLITKHGGVPHLVSMATSEHAVMQNEALVALTLIGSVVLDSTQTTLAQADIVPTIKVLLTEGDTLAEIMCNVLTLVKTLAKSGELLSLMKIADLPKIVSSLKKHEESMVSQQAKDVAAILGKG